MRIFSPAKLDRERLHPSLCNPGVMPHTQENRPPYSQGMVPLESTIENDGNYRSALAQLSEETKKLQKLRDLHALKAATRSHREDLEAIKVKVAHSQSELMELMLKVENLTGEIVRRRSQLDFPT